MVLNVVLEYVSLTCAWLVDELYEFLVAKLVYVFERGGSVVLGVELGEVG